MNGSAGGSCWIPASHNAVANKDSFVCHLCVFPTLEPRDVQETKKGS